MSDYPICGSLECIDCRARTKKLIRARRKPTYIGDIPGVPRYARGMEPPQRPWPWFFAEVPANGGPNGAVSGGSDARPVLSDSARKKAWERLVFQVAKRDRFRCQRCLLHLRKDKRSVHHIIPRADNGGDHLDNLILLCHACHDAVEISDPPLRSRTAIRGSYVD